ncbi:uncharacterized protein LOC117340846 [Pecten maximus]|uniref:uncharacterized protein LOC117340846 n=1 Tax=Pecten maximus TaxID=6579 RepID=UPI0014584EB4|nr:uncharacterized protein LOC117340846 [Pecten maximus]
MDTCDTIDSVSKLNTFQKVTIKAKVMDKSPPEQLSTKSKSLTKADVVVADSTGSIKLTLWEQVIEQIEVSKSYLMKSLTVREFDNNKILSSSQDSAFEEVDDIGHVKFENQKSLHDSMTVTADILSVNCQTINNCVSCRKNLPPVNSDIPTIKCLHCGIRQRIASIATSYKCEIVCNTQKGHKTFFIPNRVLQSSDITAGLTSADQIEDCLLQQPKITLSLSNAFVTHMQTCNMPSTSDDTTDSCSSEPPKSVSIV